MRSHRDREITKGALILDGLQKARHPESKEAVKAQMEQWMHTWRSNYDITSKYYQTMAMALWYLTNFKDEPTGL